MLFVYWGTNESRGAWGLLAEAERVVIPAYVTEHSKTFEVFDQQGERRRAEVIAQDGDVAVLTIAGAFKSSVPLAGYSQGVTTGGRVRAFVHQGETWMWLTGTVQGAIPRNGTEYVQVQFEQPVPPGSGGALIEIDGAPAALLIQVLQPDPKSTATIAIALELRYLMKGALGSAMHASVATHPEPPWESLSASAWDALEWADAARRNVNEDRIHMEHLIWGLMREDQGPTRRLMNSVGIGDRELKNAIERVVKVVMPEPRQVNRERFDDPPLTSKHVRDALLHAAERAGKPGEQPTRLSSRDLLYGALAVEDCTMIQALARRGVPIGRSLPDDEGLDDRNDARPTDESVPSDWMHAATRFHREAAGSEHCLRVGEYAAAVAEALDTSEGAASFAIFGHWGRGKTFLAKRIEEALASRVRTEHRYATVWFSAWKFPAAPEVWAHLYETFANAAYDRGWTQQVPRAVRAKLDKSGLLPMVGYLAIAAFGLLPMGLWLRAAWAIWLSIGWVGFVGAFAVYRLYRAMRGPIAEMVTDAITPVRHADNLGLQATVGRDLQALIRGWLKPPSAGAGAIALFVLVVLGFGAGLWICFRDALPVWGLAILVGSWLAIVVGVTAWVYWVGRDSNRILLIVDDLDRCEPEHIIRVIESIRLHVEEPALGNSVQMLALVEEEVLRWAIRTKFKALIEAQPGHERRVVQDTLEKLFLAHLRLPPIGDDDLEDAMRRFLDSNGEPARELSATTTRPSSPSRLRA